MPPLPPMRPDVAWKRIEAEVAELRRQLVEIRSTVRALGATTVDRGDLTLTGGGWMRVRDGGGIELLDGGQVINRGGVISTVDEATGAVARMIGSRLLFSEQADQRRWAAIGVDPGGDLGYLRIFPPAADGEFAKNSITLKGTDSGPGAFWVYTDGTAQIVADRDAILTTEQTLFLTGDFIQLNATGTGIGLYGTPTTGSPANLFLGTVNGQWQVARSSSSRRYKRDIADLTVDPDAVKRWRPRTWRDRADVDAVGDDAATHVGFIAEEVAEVGTPEFTTSDEDGQIDGLAYDRMAAVGLHALAMQQEQRITDLEAENAVLRDRLAAIEAHLGITGSED